MVLALVALAILAPLGALWFVSRPMRSVVPLFAATLPIASAVKVAVPLPAPFNTLSTVLGGLAIVACLAHVVLYRRGRVPTLPVGMWLLYLGWATVSTFWALNQGAALRALVIAFPLVLLVVSVALVPSEEADFDFLRVAVIASGIVVGVYALYLLVTGSPLPAHGVSQRLSLKTGPEEANPNTLAAALLLPMIVSLERTIFGGTRWWRPAIWRGLGAAGALLSVEAIVMTASRGGILTASVIFLLTLFFCAAAPGGKRLVGRTLLGITGLLVGVGVLWFITSTLAPQAVVRAVETRVLNPATRRVARAELDSSSRLEIWTTGVLACKDRCVVGVGIGNFPEVYNRLYGFSGTNENAGSNRPAHNLYLGLAVELGMVGLTLVGLALASEWIALSTLQMRRLAPSLKAAILAILIVNFFLSSMWFKYVWLVLLLVRAAESAMEPRTAVAAQHLHPPSVSYAATN